MDMLDIASPIRVRRPFYYDGPVPRSKSWLNRALILRSIFPGLIIEGWHPSEADGEDVTHIGQALRDLAAGKREFKIGDSGTGFRFLLARLSRESGEFLIHGSERLFSRPHLELYRVLGLLGAKVRVESPTSVRLGARGWPKGNIQLSVDAAESSQFASALLLAGSNIGDGVSLEVRTHADSPMRSGGYLEMTTRMLEQIGCQVSRLNSRGQMLIQIKAPAGDVKLSVHAEPDWSSVFTLACLASVETAGLLKLSERDSQTLATTAQPDAIGLSFLEQSGVHIERGRHIEVHGRRQRHGIDCDLGGAPDLFPCLAAVLATAEGASTLSGAPQLRLKESDRIRTTVETLRSVGISVEERPDGIRLAGGAPPAWWHERREMQSAIVCNPDHDHRAAFQVGVLAQAGAPVQVSERGVVAKSLPLFWSIVEGDARRFAIIGHRGSGKTRAGHTWAHRAQAEFIDLDEQIGGSKTFDLVGETEFRHLERETFEKIDRQTRSSFDPVMLSVGGGFDPALLHEGWEAIWVRRATDRDDRIFIDRPRLNPALNVRDEWRLRRDTREPRFQARADRVLAIPEGILENDVIETRWFEDVLDVGSLATNGGVMSLTSERRLVSTLERWLRWGVQRIEVRDDLIRSEEAWNVIAKVPAERLLISLRDSSQLKSTLARVRDLALVDIPFRFYKNLSLHERPPLEQTVISIHQEDLEALGESDPYRLASSLKETVRLVKVAVPTESFSELRTGHEWAMSEPKRRVYLPMSVSAARPRWSWYRLLMAERRATLSFLREDNGTSLDQPTLYEWLRFKDAVQNAQTRSFAAILGDPVHHSRTPTEHADFFAKRGMPVLAIAMRADEVGNGLSFLKDLGLQAAAVTAPLKAAIGTELQCDGPVNTIWKAGGTFAGASTDGEGFAELMLLAGVAPTERMVIWGGGGVLPAVQSVAANTVSVSARTGLVRESGESVSPARVLIWASGSERGAWSNAFKPEIVIDLSYTEDSAGLEVALESKAKYVSGLQMFKAQARRQRELWEANL